MILLAFMAALSLGAFAQTAQQVLDKTAKVIGNKTQWTYMKKTNEVNVSNPTQAQQMSMNPYTFINIYKTGYTSTMKTIGSNYKVRLVAQNKKRTVQELILTIDKKSYIPSQIKMRQGNTWSTITVSNFKAKSISNSTFVFNSKDFPKAEIVDLR